MALMFMLASPSLRDDRDPSRFQAGSTVSYRAIYSSRESAAGTFLHPSCFDGVFFLYGGPGDVGK
ncbi:MAG: hypothetical protein A3A88_06800 [Nitrospirae bacterium RIFCSPLOWO2_01_FULL_62_17]|nr:MAG: hypothetical protein A3A88_06800 [Nitrospirae bacterium RIFCSPLOWO2_01_FULL_62_17]